MSVYGGFLYSEDFYGPSAEDLPFKWAVQVDWDGDGVFDGFNEALNSLYSLEISRGRDHMIASEGRGLMNFEPGEATLKFYDNDERLVLMNYDSPIYPYQLPGKEIKIGVLDDATETFYPLFHGHIYSITPVLKSGEYTVIIKAYDLAYWLETQQYSSSTLQTDIGPDDAAQIILDGVGWSWGYDLEDTGDTFPAWWVWDKESALKSMEDIYRPLAMKGFVGTDGRYKLISPYRTAPDEADVDTDLILDDIDFVYPYENIRNLIEYRVSGRTEQSTGVIWQLEDIPVVLAGDSLEIWAEFTYNNEKVPATSIDDPVSGTDYTMNSQEDGGGANLTPDFTVSVDKFAAVAKLTVTNTGGSDGYITLLRLQGDAYTAEEVTTTKREDTTSQGIYGIRRMLIENHLMQDTGTAEDVADFMLNNFADPHVFLEFNVINDVNALDWELADILDMDDYGVFEIGYISYKWDRDGTGQAFIAGCHLEPSFTLSIDRWQFPTILGRTSILSSD